MNWFDDSTALRRPPPSHSPRSAAPDAHDGLAAAVLVALAAVAGLVWATTLLAGLASTGHWPDVAAADVPGALWRLPGTLADPAAAWPSPDGGGLPGPVAWWSTFAALVALAAGTAFAAFHHPQGGRSRSGAEAGWASGRDLRDLRVRRRDRTRLVVGRAGRGLVATEARHSLLVIGPTQTGKTTGLAVPAILEWEGPVVATSVKGDLLADTYRWRSTLGDAWVYDPVGATDHPAATWSPLAGCRTWAGARKMAAELAEAARVASGRGVDNADFWFSSAAKLLAPYLFAAATRGHTMSDVVRWVDGQDRVEARRVLAGSGHAEALLAHDATWKRDDRTRSSIFTTTEVILAAYADPRVAASAATSTISPDRLLDGGPHTLYLVAPPADQRRLRPLFATLAGQVIGAAYAKVAATGRPLDPPLLVVLDEAANIAPIPDLATIASTAASHGIQLVTVWQDLAQIRARYGNESATIVNNHRAKLVLGGVGDLDTLDYASRLAGDEDTPTTTVSTDATGRRSTTAATQRRRLLAPETLRRLAPGHGVLVYGHLAPARIRLRPWYRDRRLRRRAHPAGATPPGTASTGPASTGAPAASPDRSRRERA